MVQTLLTNDETDFAWQSQLRYALDANAPSSSSSSSSSSNDASNASLLSVLQMTTHLSYGFEYLVRVFRNRFWVQFNTRITGQLHQARDHPSH